VEGGGGAVLLEKAADIDYRNRRRGRLLAVLVVSTRDEPCGHVGRAQGACCELLHRRRRSRFSCAFHSGTRTTVRRVIFSSRTIFAVVVAE
jgi:pyrimidine deaminase RibD-like protein